jgi:hypothetical protein
MDICERVFCSRCRGPGELNFVVMNSCVKLLNFFPNENMEHIFIPQYMKAADLLINRTDHTNEHSDHGKVFISTQSDRIR